MATDTEMAPNREIDQVLNQTEIGAWIAKNKAVVVIFAVLLFGGIFGWGGYHSLQGKKEQELGKKIYEFQESSYTQLIDKKLSPADYAIKFKALQKEIGDFEGLAPVLIKSSEHLVEQGAYKEASEILRIGLNSYDTPILSNMLSLHLASALEDLKDYNGAITVLEDLNTSSKKLFEDKVYLDLGRLYIAAGNKEKAKLNLQYLIDNGKEAEFIKLAKLHLQDL